MKLLPKLILPAILLGYLMFSTSALCVTDVEHTLAEIQAAIDAGNAAQFEELVDVNGILANGFDRFLQKISAPENSTQIPPMLSLMVSGLASNPSMRQLLLAQTRAFILNGITTGAFSGNTRGSAPNSGNIGQLFSDISTGRKELTPMGNAEKVEGGWLLPFMLHDYGNGRDYGIIGYFEKSQNQYRLMDVRNMNELFDILLQEANQ